MRSLILGMAVIAALLALFYSQSDEHASTYLERSVPYVGTGVPRSDGIDGTGVLVAVIDTGVDYNHPDLLGWGPDGKVVGGYNFVQEGILPIDTNGHGTQVAGVIAADGQTVGIAPGAGILAYKVSEDGEGVSSDLIVRAVEMAVMDGADIINISLGVNKINEKIERAVRYAIDRGVFVVVAAGNDGPIQGSIGSPGGSYGAVTVGATYNNLTSSLVATLTVGERQYTVIPMVGSPKLEEPVNGRIVFGGYGKAGEIGDAADSILVVERGSDIPGELLYFSAKENNAAAAGARALIVYNNEPGIFLGELLHEFSGPGYSPQIPVVSMDREEGLEIVTSDSDAVMHLFYNPDFAAHFSSRGPVSPFYIKPDIMAPGAYINTTQNNAAYNFTSGTSYAAPHVAGAAALLLQKNPELTISELRSIILTTAQPVTDAYGDRFPVHSAGSGRLDIAGAYEADLVITPPSFAASISPQKDTALVTLDLRPINGALGSVGISFDAPGLNPSHRLEGHALHLNITGSEYGQHEARIDITHGKNMYVVPFIIHHTPGSIHAEQLKDELVFDVSHPEGWSFAKISVTDSKDGKTRTVTAVPGESPSLKIYENSEYWAEARIKTGDTSSGAFDTILVTSLPGAHAPPVEIAARPVMLIAGIAAIIGVTGMLWARR